MIVRTVLERRTLTGDTRSNDHVNGKNLMDVRVSWRPGLAVVQPFQLARRKIPDDLAVIVVEEVANVELSLAEVKIGEEREQLIRGQRTTGLQRSVADTEQPVFVVMIVNGMPALALKLPGFLPDWRESKSLAERSTPQRNAATTETSVAALAIDANEWAVLRLLPTTVAVVVRSIFS